MLSHFLVAANLGIAGKSRLLILSLAAGDYGWCSRDERSRSDYA